MMDGFSSWRVGLNTKRFHHLISLVLAGVPIGVCGCVCVCMCVCVCVCVCVFVVFDRSLNWFFSSFFFIPTILHSLTIETNRGFFPTFLAFLKNWNLFNQFILCFLRISLEMWLAWKSMKVVGVLPGILFFSKSENVWEKIFFLLQSCYPCESLKDEKR